MNKREQLVFDLKMAITNSGDWFTVELFKLMLKADCCNREKLRTGFPEEFMAFELWRRYGKDFLDKPLKYDWFSIAQ